MIATRSHGRFRPLAATGALVLGLVLAGCGAEKDDSGVATAGGDATATGGTDAADLDDRDRMLAFTQCLRDNGLDVEDPAEGEGLKLVFGRGMDRAKVDAAMEACREYAPEGGPDGQPVNDEAMLEFAQCMRENGVEAFSDPDGGGMMIGPEVADDPDFEAAQEECGDIMGDLRRSEP